MQYTLLAWKNTQTPYSEQFEDIYFSEQGGMAESEHVFIKGNNLLQRIPKTSHLTIGELGFGTGLNFLLTCYWWKKLAPQNARLHFFSIEKFPLHPEDLSKAWQNWPTLALFSSELSKKLPPPLPGFHKIYLDNQSISLSLVYGEASLLVPKMVAQMDAWFLDGFSPRCNPKLWSELVFSEVFRLTRPDGTFATYCSAGEVRRTLSKVGFVVTKQKGFGKKREMLIGKKKGYLTNNSAMAPWFHHEPQRAIQNSKKAIIIGGGLSGCTTAYALATRGWEVELWEQENQLASKASGNNGAILFPYWSQEPNIYSRFYWNALSFADRYLKNLDIPYQDRGILYLPKANELKRFQQVIENINLPTTYLEWISKEKASKVAQIKINQSAMHLKIGGWVSPKKLCLLLSNHPKIQLKLKTKACRLVQQQGIWQVIDKNHQSQAPILILANAWEAQAFFQHEQIPLKKVRGQSSLIPSTVEISPLTLPICDGGYLLPSQEGFHELGATFDPQDKSSSIKNEDHKRNLGILNRLLSNKLTLPSSEPLKGRVAFRTITLDRLPVIGPAPDWFFYEKAYPEIRHGRPMNNYPQAKYQSGLFLNLAHGSKGLLSCPLSAELLASYLNGEALPIEADLLEALHPARFLIRKLKRH